MGIRFEYESASRTMIDSKDKEAPPPAKPKPTPAPAPGGWRFDDWAAI